MAQVAALLVRVASMVILARLLFPKDFGLLGMVVAFTGFLSIFRDFGLSLASVTRVSITEDQRSTLFWVNVAAGGVLAALCAAVAPVLVIFYAEPRLGQITIALGMGFVFSGASAQHRAILQRAMRFRELAVVDTVSLFLGAVVGISMAALGFGYWALVAMTVTPQVASMLGVWRATRWNPGGPRRGANVRSMLQYGGTVTLNSVVVYIAYNVDKVLVGRFWGADALGIYGRAYQLINYPSDVLNSAVAQVAFPALARLQNDPVRLRSFFRRGYSLLFVVALPMSVACALFAEDIVEVFLGPKWMEAASIFRLLAPTTIVFALVNLFGCLMMATGHALRSLKIALLIAPTVIAGCVVGLPYGPQGVAAGFSVAMVLLALPVIVWSSHGMPISMRDVLGAISPALISIVAGVAMVALSQQYVQAIEPVLLRLTVQTGVLFGVYSLVLLFALNQWTYYLKILDELRASRL
jgi:PST family polysaccharide transporter